MLLKTTRTAVLTVGALDMLMGQEDPCCPHCCGFCWVLQDMISHADLDDIIRKAPIHMYEDASWYDRKTARVRSLLVQSHWDRTCTHGIEEETDDADDVGAGADGAEDAGRLVR